MPRLVVGIVAVVVGSGWLAVASAAATSGENEPGNGALGTQRDRAVIILPAPPDPERSITYAQLALGGGYSCVVMASNASEAKWEGTVQLRQATFSPWSGAWAVNGEPVSGDYGLVLEPHATSKLVLTGDQSLRTGYLHVVAGNSSSIEDVAVSFFFTLEQGAQLSDSIGMPGGSFGRSFVFPVERSHWVDTGFAWAPGWQFELIPFPVTSAVPAATYPVVTASLFNAQGQEVDHQEIPLTGHLARFFSEVFQGVPEDFLGKVVFDSPENIFLTVMRLNLTPQGAIQLTSVPPASLADDEGPAFAIYPQLALGGGYQCILTVGNKSEAPWKGTALLRQGGEAAWGSAWSLNGQPKTGASSFDIVLAAHQTAQFVLGGDQLARSGYLRIVPDEGLSAQSLAMSFFYNYSPAASLTDAIGVPPGSAGRAFVFPVERSATVNTGFAWSPESPEEENPETGTPEPFAVLLTLYDEAGAKMSQATLLCDGHLARFFPEALPGVPSSFVGKMVVEAERRISLTVIRLESSGSGFQLTAVPAAAVIEKPLPFCYTMDGFEAYLQAHPDYAAQRTALDNLFANYVARLAQEGEAGLRSGVVVIPVVVHVIYKTRAQNISNAQVRSQIAILNRDYRKRNRDVGKVPAPYKPRVGDMRIEFRLAARDPDGKPTTGITRTKTDKAVFPRDPANRFTSAGVPMKFSSTGGVDAWPAGQYLNIWVCNLQSPLLGFSTFPGDPANVDGVVIDYEYFGDVGTAKAPYDRGRTATHEIAHWLNIRHIWGDDQNSGDVCAGSDLIDDTPNQAIAHSDSPVFPKVTCNNGPHGDMFMNYMDYTYDKSMYMFTAGQSKRMDAALFEVRRSILGSDGLISPEGLQNWDLFSQDSAYDFGAEPNKTSTVLYQTLDIWARNSNDGLVRQEHQNPIASQANYVYVRVRNRGLSDAPDARVKLYWAKASTGLGWPKPWDGSVTQPAVMGGLIGEKPTGVIPARGFTILEFSWTPPSPAAYAAFGADKVHFCLLSRIETSTSAPYGMTFAETGNLAQNVRNNNNIVWKNVSVAEPVVSGGREVWTLVANNSDALATYSLRFPVDVEPGKLSLFDWGTIQLDLGPDLFAQWIQNGATGSGIEILAPPIIRIAGPNATIDQIDLGPGEYKPVRMSFVPFLPLLEGTYVFEAPLEQYETSGGVDLFVGGQIFLVKSDSSAVVVPGMSGVAQHR
jgi:hypothetical protein